MNAIRLSQVTLLFIFPEYSGVACSVDSNSRKFIPIIGNRYGSATTGCKSPAVKIEGITTKICFRQVYTAGHIAAFYRGFVWVLIIIIIEIRKY